MRIICFVIAAVLLVAVPTSVPASVMAQDYDVLIKGGTVVDGTGSGRQHVDIAVKGDVIVAVGADLKGSAIKIVDASGLMITPGFIDLHSHAERQLLKMPYLENNLRQGITTILGGNCGGSPLHTAEFFAKVKSQGTALNVGLLIGHNTVRKAVMKRVNRKATAVELAAMSNFVRKAMGEGAFGLSTGLKYIPGAYAPTSEVVLLASVAAKNKGIYATHMREEGLGLLKSVDESIEIGRQAQIPVHISHHKAAGVPTWGQSKVSLKMIDDARASGMDVTLDQYPYAASSTNFGVLIPSWALAGGFDAYRERLKDPIVRAKIKKEVIHIIKTDRGGNDVSRIQVARYNKNPSYNGKTYKEILIGRGVKPTIENAAELAIEMQKAGGGSAIYHAMHEDDVVRIMQHPYTSIVTDGHGVLLGKGSPHPRNYGAYPRVLAKYVREQKNISLPEAIRKMTSLPASRMSLADRGIVAVGKKADILIFDEHKIRDMATFVKPHQYSIGIRDVMINGQFVIREHKKQNILSGQVLRHNAKEL